MINWKNFCIVGCLGALAGAVSGILVSFLLPEARFLTHTVVSSIAGAFVGTLCSISGLHVYSPK